MATKPATAREPILLNAETYWELANRLSALHEEGKLGVTHDDLLLIMWALGGYTMDLLRTRAGK